MQIHYRQYLRGIALGTLCLSASALSVLYFDRPIEDYIHRVVTGKASSFAVWFGDISDPALLLAASGLAYFLFRYGRVGRQLVHRALLLLVSGGAASLAAMILKAVFGRSRPELLLQNGDYRFDFFHPGSGFDSFPSEHAAVGVAIATVLSMLCPVYRPTFLFLGILVAGARLAAGAHYLSDLLAGALIGVVTANAFAAAFIHNGYLIRIGGGDNDR